MWSHSHTRALVAAVLAGVCASAGCLNPHLNPFPPTANRPGLDTPPVRTNDKSTPAGVDNPTEDSLVQAQYRPTIPPPPATAPATLPVPGGLAVPVPPTQAQPLPLPRELGGDPHNRGTPTVTGEKLVLGPNELPIDRALELTQRIDALVAENKALQARIVALEANGLTREQAMNEAIREVERATEEVAKARAEVQVLRTELIALRDKLKDVEAAELETLNTVIEALKQLLEDE